MGRTEASQLNLLLFPGLGGLLSPEDVKRLLHRNIGEEVGDIKAHQNLITFHVATAHPSLKFPGVADIGTSLDVKQD